MKVRMTTWSVQSRNGGVDAFLKRPAFDDKAEVLARRVLAGIQSGGEKTIARFIRQFDRVSLTPAEFRVAAPEIQRSADDVPPRFRRAIRETSRRVAAFTRAGLKKNWILRVKGRGRLGERFIPLDRVGVYVPGGAAPLASTAVMTVAVARAAGVKQIVACTPCGRDKRVNAALLHALDYAGATEIYRVGGIQAIGLMAYGTERISKVQKIVGPGGIFVTAAKRQVYGHVALDLVAGPSEIAVLADASADPRFVAADLLSQAEHGTGMEKALLVTSSAALAGKVQRELEVQSARLSRRKAVEIVMKRGMLLVVVKNLEEGMELCNRFAPEHFEIMTKRPSQWLEKVRCAGAVFLGPWTPESVGDFAAGPSHVLPTGGAAAMFSGLTGDDFRRRCSLIDFSASDLKRVLPVIGAFGEMEGLDAHVRSARIRFE